MIPMTYAAPGERTSPIFCAAFAKGCGGQVQIGGPLRPGPVALWGSPQLWPLFLQAQAEKRTYYYGDNSYFGRGEYYRITRNTLQHDGTGPGNAKRFAAFGLSIQPWRQNGTHIVVCPNSPAHFKLFNQDVNVWLRDVVATLTRHTDRPIRIRWKTRAKAYPLSHDLEGAWAVVVWSSNSAVEAIVAGVPVFVQSKHAAAYRLGLANLERIEDPIYPDDRTREQFCHSLAAHQWTAEEIGRGVAWRALRDPSERAA